MASFRSFLLDCNRRKIGFSLGFALVFTLVDTLAQAAGEVPVGWSNVALWRIVLAAIGSLLAVWLILSVQDWQIVRQSRGNVSVNIGVDGEANINADTDKTTIDRDLTSVGSNTELGTNTDRRNDRNEISNAETSLSAGKLDTDNIQIDKLDSSNVKTGKLDTNNTQADKSRHPVAVKASTWILLLAWLLMYLHYWPLASMSDIPSEIISPLLLSVQHPLIYSWIVSGFATGSQAWLGTMLPGIVLLSLLQIVAWVTACRYLLGTLSRIGVRPIALWILVGYLAIFPLVGNYSFAIVKDGMFGIFVVLLIPLLLRVWHTRGEILCKASFLLALGGTFIGFSVTRNNGLVVAIVLLALLIVRYWRYWPKTLPLFSAVLVVSLIPSVISTHFAGGQKFVETVGVPLQMLGYTVTYNPGCLSEDAEEYFTTLIDLEEWAKVYDPETVDALKDSSAFATEELQQTRGEFLQQFFGTLLTCPGEMVSGFLAHTDHLWRIDSEVSGTHAQSYFSEAVTNYPANRQMWIDWWAEQGVSNQSLLPDFLQNTLGKWYDWGIKHTPGPGSWFWIGALLICGFAYRKRAEWIPIVVPILLLWLTLVVAAPTTHPFRYIEPIIIVVPVLTAVLFGRVPRFTPSIWQKSWHK